MKGLLANGIWKLLDVIAGIIVKIHKNYESKKAQKKRDRIINNPADEWLRMYKREENTPKADTGKPRKD